MSDLANLRQQWTTLYSHTLPRLPKTCSPVQQRWPVSLDHCFARIILDYVIGHGEKQWDQVIDSPAVSNMSKQQLHDAIALGEQIISGEANLAYLNELSLQCRGKGEKNDNGIPKDGTQIQAEPASSENVSRKRILIGMTESIQDIAHKRAKLEKRQSILAFSGFLEPTDATCQPPSTTDLKSNPSGISTDLKSKTPEISTDLKSKTPEISTDLKQIAQRVRSHPSLSQYRKKLYLTLLSVPRGHYTTYAAMSDFLNSSARAVGSGMRNNPFAPDVPCHRVLAADGSIGGFHGDWGKVGKYAKKKIELLRGEGVRFDGKGRVVGAPFRQFHSFEHPG